MLKGKILMQEGKPFISQKNGTVYQKYLIQVEDCLIESVCDTTKALVVGDEVELALRSTTDRFGNKSAVVVLAY